MLQSKAARDKGFEMTVPKQLPSFETAIKKGAEETFYRSDESDRLARAKRWIEQARGKEQEPKE